MTEDRLRLGAIELKMAGNGSLLVRATDIDHVVVACVRDPAAVERIKRQYEGRMDYEYGRATTRELHDAIERRISEVPLVDRCTVVLRSQAKHEVLNSKEELLNVIRDS
jgi:hypothetical protein